MWRPDNAPRTATGVLSSTPFSSPRLSSGCPSDGWGEDIHTSNSRGNRVGNDFYFYSRCSFEDANTMWGNVGAYHLDELYDYNRSAFTRLMRRCSSIEQSTTSTLFLFLSPQFSVNYRDAFDVLVTCAQERTLRVIAMEEAHVHVQHGTSFRDDIRALRVEFFRQIYGNQPSD